MVARGGTMTEDEQRPTMLEGARALVPRINDDLAATAPPNVPPPKVWMLAIQMHLEEANKAYTARDWDRFRSTTVMLTATTLGFCSYTDLRLAAGGRRSQL
jgi:hypothetical protein